MYLFLSLVNACHWCCCLYVRYTLSLFLTIFLWPSSLLLYHGHLGLDFLLCFSSGISLSSVLVSSFILIKLHFILVFASPEKTSDYVRNNYNIKLELDTDDVSYHGVRKCVIKSTDIVSWLTILPMTNWTFILTDAEFSTRISLCHSGFKGLAISSV